MTPQENPPSLWAKLPVSLRAIIIGIVIALIPANLWSVLLVSLRVPIAASLEVVFLGLYIWWASGGGPPHRTRAARGRAFRSGRLSPAQCFWGLIGALFFAVTIHAAIVLLFRFVPFPTAAFRRGYDLSFIRSLPMKWVAVVVSAMSAGICEETGFRGYMQQPIEQRHGPTVAILISSFFFMLVHLTKAWAMIGMVPIVFGAGALLGLLAWSSGSLIPSMIGHIAMDIGLFAYWWTGIAGTFSARPITETGVDRPFLITCVVLTATLIIVLLAAWRLRKIRVSTSITAFA
jgi:membrane protease YdiL (CAAX protease family)